MQKFRGHERADTAPPIIARAWPGAKHLLQVPGEDKPPEPKRQPPAAKFLARMPPDQGLLHLDLGAGLLELGLGLLGVLLGHLLEHRLRRTVDEVLGLLEAQ